MGTHDSANDQTCSYCGTAFDASDAAELVLADSATLFVARCGQCGGVHRRVHTNTFFGAHNGLRQHAADCPGRECDRDEYHPTEDNTPWGFPTCRHCTIPDPLTHLTGFVGQLVQKTQQSSEQNTALQEHNTALTLQNRAHKAHFAAVVRALFDDRVFDAPENAEHAVLSALGAVQRLLYYSWNDVDFTYHCLTDRERDAVDEPTFRVLSLFARRADVTPAADPRRI